MLVNFMSFKKIKLFLIIIIFLVSGAGCVSKEGFKFNNDNSIPFANVNIPVGDCSGSVFKMPGMNENQKALVLTNGHCVGLGKFMNQFPDNGEFLINSFVSDTLFLKRDKSEVGDTIQYKKVLFATMTDADLAIIEVEKTYKEIEKLGYKVFSLAKESPTVGMILEYDSYNRDVKSICVVEKIIEQLKEGPWTWRNVVRMKEGKECVPEHGQSGTPGIDPISKNIYAIINTTYEGGEACDFNNPCEVDIVTKQISTGKLWQAYAIPVNQLYNCYDSSNGKFNFDLETCEIK